MFERLEDKMNMVITPMAIVGMLITIIILATAPTWMKPLMKVELPKAHTALSERKQNTTISINEKGEIAVDDTDISWDRLHAALLIALKYNKDKYVIIRADRRAKYRELVEAMHCAKRAGAKLISIATEQKRRR